MSKPIVRVVLLAALTGLLLLPGLAAGRTAPIPVVAAFAVESGDWIPLPEEDMRRAAADAALSRLSDAGRLDIVEDEAAARAGSLLLEVALIGPAETAKLTITLDVPGSPTLVSTASISVRALDHAGIFGALEHVGEQAADRLVAKLDLLRDPKLRPGDGSGAPLGDGERRRVYDEAQQAKRTGRYAEARSGFESVVATAPGPDDALKRLAEDELRYGLPLFEARQSLNEIGRLSRPGQQPSREAAMARAEHLFRQIQAENPSDVARVAEAQRALDDLVVMSTALSNAMRAEARNRAHSLRMMMMQHTLMEGDCPDAELARVLMSEMNVRMELEDVRSEGSEGRRYRLRIPGGRARMELVCTPWEGVEIVEPGGASSRLPAAAR